MIPTSAVHIEGGILSNDLLARLRLLDPRLPGIAPTDYERAPGESIHEAIGRSWSRLTSVWRNFSRFLASAPEGQALTGDTRDRWLLPLFQELGFGRLERSETRVLDKSNFPISHRWQRLPIHLIGARLPLDRRTKGVAHAASASPHGLLQDFLNRSDESLWGIVTNGLSLRLLRDNAALTRQAFVEFDLEEIFTNELYAEFVLLWLLIHASRFSGSDPRSWVIEQWAKTAAESGARALERLRDGVEKALADLGSGFIAHPANAALIDRLRSGQLRPDDYKRQLLRIIYRLLFIFVAEDRDLLLDPSAPREAADRYRRHYSTRLLRDRAVRLAGTPHGDGWEHVKELIRMLGAGEVRLAVPALGSDLFKPDACPDLDVAQVANKYLYSAVKHLCITRDGDVKRPTDFRSLGAEELGGIYESLLELNPTVNLSARRFELEAASGNDRKTTGSYYTPTELISCLLDSALDPALDQALKQDPTGKAILDLRVCDPACGSGHFLVAAAHRMARRLAAARTGEAEPSPEETRHALREVIAKCIYGVDVNPLAVELCQVSLWLEALEPGKALAYLRHRIRWGNSLLGATPQLVFAGIPDGAFDPITGDDKKIAAARKKLNKAERENLGAQSVSVFAPTARAESNLEATLKILTAGDDGTADGIRRMEEADRQLREDAAVVAAQWAADLWLGSFLVPKKDDAPQITTQLVREALRGRLSGLDESAAGVVRRLCREDYRVFHWHVEFPDVFHGNAGGFDVVLGNPPWERVKLSEQEFFAARDERIATAPNASTRKKLIASLDQENPQLWAAYQDELRHSEAASQLLRLSGRFPKCGRGDVNTYAVFAELMTSLIRPTGRAGVIVPTGIATDDGNKHFFQMLIEENRLASLFDFENKQRLFPAVHPEQRFCLLTCIGPGQKKATAAELAFFLQTTQELDEEQRRFTLSAREIELVNPNTRTCPIFRSRRDAQLTKAIYRRVPILQRETGDPESEGHWDLRLWTMYHMSNDSHLFQSRDSADGGGGELNGNAMLKDGLLHLPLYEGKFTSRHDHRAGTFMDCTRDQVESGNERLSTSLEKDNPHFVVTPRYWVSECALARAAEGRKSTAWLTFHDVVNVNNERTFAATITPPIAVGNTLPILQTEGSHGAYDNALLSANLNSLVFDYIARLKISSRHCNFFIAKQLPVFPPSTFEQRFPWIDEPQTLREWLLPRVMELTYTAWDLEHYARECGFDGPPFRWDDERRFLLNCELDAAFFHLYLPCSARAEWVPARDDSSEELSDLKASFATPREAAAYILDTFSVLKRREESAYGEYRTRRVTLEIYDLFLDAFKSGRPYLTRLNPPPADPRIAHVSRGP